MPCHSDRVRRNYHTVKIVPREIPSQCAMGVSAYVTKLEIATCVSKRELRRMLILKMADELSAAWPGEEEPRASQNRQ